MEERKAPAGTRSAKGLQGGEGIGGEPEETVRVGEKRPVEPEDDQ